MSEIDFLLSSRRTSFISSQTGSQIWVKFRSSETLSPKSTWFFEMRTQNRFLTILLGGISVSSLKIKYVSQSQNSFPDGWNLCHIFLHRDKKRGEHHWKLYKWSGISRIFGNSPNFGTTYLGAQEELEARETCVVTPGTWSKRRKNPSEKILSQKNFTAR